VHSQLLANICDKWCVQSQVLLNVRSRSWTQVLTELTAGVWTRVDRRTCRSWRRRRPSRRAPTPLSWPHQHQQHLHLVGIPVKRYTVKPELAVTVIKQPTCPKQPYRMFPNFNFVLIFTSAKQPPALSSHTEYSQTLFLCWYSPPLSSPSALSSHFLCFPWVAA